MPVGDNYDEEKLVEEMPEGHCYIFGSEPLIIDENGVPTRRFELGSHGVVELPIEDEPITKVDLEEFKKRNGQLNEDRCYDILEVGYWCGDEYTKYDEGFIKFRQDSQEWCKQQNKS